LPRVSHILNNFNGGELSPEFEGRVDQKKYHEGAKRIENFIVHPEGGLHKRPGTRHVTTVADSTKKSRLIPFIFSTEQAYILEFGDRVIRVFADDVQLVVPTQIVTVAPSTTTEEFEFKDHSYVDGQGPYHISGAALPGGLLASTDYFIVLPATSTFTDTDITAGDITITGHGYSDQQGPFRLSTTGALPSGVDPAFFSANVDYFVQVQDVDTIRLSLTPTSADIIPTALEGGTHTLSPTNDYKRDKFRLSLTSGGAAINITGAGTPSYTFTPNPGGAAIILEIVSPYVESELYDLHFVQSADTLFINHPQHRPLQIGRTSNTQWAVDHPNILDGPYNDENTDDAALITASATTGTDINLTLSGTITLNDGVGWLPKDIGRLVRMKVGTTDWGSVEITGFHNSTIAHGTVIFSPGGTAATAAFRFGSWYPGNYPSTLSFGDQRLWHAGAPDTPQTIYGSTTAFYTNFAPTDIDGEVVDTNAVTFRLGSNQVDSIRWVSVQRNLYLGTPSSILTARASLEGESITPTNINIPTISYMGSNAVQPQNIGAHLIYLARNHQSAYALGPGVDVDDPAPTDLTLLAKHILGRTKTVTTMAFQQDREQVIWFTRSDGKLVALTYVPEQQVYAWHNHKLGGNFGGGEAVVDCVAVIPSRDGTHDELWMIVKRTINGATVRHIEFMEDEWLDDVQNSMRFLDSAPAAYSGVATATITGLDHLEGETVSILAEGAVHPTRVVASGSITLDNTYTDVVAGLGYVSELETMRLELPDREGSSMGKVARIDHVALRVYNSFGGEIGPDVTHLDPMIMRDASDMMDSSPPGFTGDEKVSFAGPFQRQKVIVVRHDQPNSFNLLAMNVIGATGMR
jgi:hypothetical protein